MKLPMGMRRNSKGLVNDLGFTGLDSRIEPYLASRMQEWKVLIMSV